MASVNRTDAYDEDDDFSGGAVAWLAAALLVGIVALLAAVYYLG